MGCSARAEVHRPNLAVPPDDLIFSSSTAGEAVRLSADMVATTARPGSLVQPNVNKWRNN